MRVNECATPPLLQGFPNEPFGIIVRMGREMGVFAGG